MPQEVKSTNPTLYNVSPEQMIKLQQLALGVVGKRSVSALVRHIADHGYIDMTDHEEPADGLSLYAPAKSYPELID